MPRGKGKDEIKISESSEENVECSGGKEDERERPSLVGDNLSKKFAPNLGVKGKGNKKSVDKTDQWLILLMGFPGSGKSTIATQLATHGFVRGSQDDQGSRGLVDKTLEKALKSRCSFVLDRCCIHPKERKQWINQAINVIKGQPLSVALVWCNVDKEECIRRVKARKGHPTLGADNAEEVINRFAKGFKPPEEWEFKYDLRFTVSDSTEAKEVVAQLRDLPILKPKKNKS